MNRAAPLAILALFAAACEIQVEGAAGRSCDTAQDCPDGLVCVALSTGGARTCEALLPSSQGEVREPDAGVAYYCSEVKPILDEHCISCHSDPPTNRAPATLRLDVYATDGGVPGASQVADQIVYRAVYRQDMPPFPLRELTADERGALRAWEQSGAQLCDGG